MDNDGFVISQLSDIVSQRRLSRIEEIVAQRMRYLTIVLEDIYQSQNASAVLRTCECFGIQDVHIIENKNLYNINPMVVQGSDKWLTLHKYNQSENNSNEAVERLKADGYRIVATSLNEGSVDLVNFDVAKGKFAIAFGNEHNGVSECVMRQADECLKISMCGFTQSLNISVSAGIIISELTRKIKRHVIGWQLSEAETNNLRAEWLKRSVKNSQMLINRLTEDRDELHNNR